MPNVSTIKILSYHSISAETVSKLGFLQELISQQLSQSTPEEDSNA